MYHLWSSYTFVGAGSGLRLVINIEDYEYMAGPYSNAGIKVSLVKHTKNVDWFSMDVYLIAG